MPIVLTPLTPSPTASAYTRQNLIDDAIVYLKRSDLAASVPTFLRLAEARIARELRLRMQLVSTTLQTVAGSGDIDLPEGLLELKAIAYTDWWRLDIGSLEQVYAARQYPPVESRATVYAVQGSTLALAPVPSAAVDISITYYAKFDILTNPDDTNWLLTNHPSIYLFAVLAEAQPFMLDDDRTALWEAKYAADREALKTSDQRAAYSGASMELGSLHTQAIV